MMIKKSPVLLGILLIYVTGFSTVHLTEDFEGETLGGQPTATVVNPPTNISTVHSKVVDSSVNTAGAGQGLKLYDNDNGKAVGIEYDFVADAGSQISAVRVDLSFAALNTSGTSTAPLYISLAQYNSLLSSSSRRLTETRLFPDGTIDFISATGPDSQGNVLAAGKNTLSIFANDYDSQTVDYTGLDNNTYTLPENSIAYWLNDDLILTTTLDTSDVTAGGTVGTTENNFGRFGLYSSGGALELDYVIDDIAVRDIEAPIPPTRTIFLSDNFESETVGGQPTASLVNPSSNLSSVFAEIVGNSVNAAGTGHGLELYDNVSNKGAGIEYNFVASAPEQVSAVRVDLSLAALNMAGTSGPFYISLAQFDNTLASSSRRLTEVRLFADGTIDFVSATGSDSKDNALLAGANTLSIFANDYDSQILDYIGPDDSTNSLPENSVAYWLNDTLMLTTTLDTNDVTIAGTVGTTENNFGRFGLYSSSGALELDYVIDNIVIGGIEEPASGGPTEPPAEFSVAAAASLGFGSDVLNWTPEAGYTYSVWYSTNLLDGFQPLETNLNDSVTSLTNIITTSPVFYKIEAQW